VTAIRRCSLALENDYLCVVQAPMVTLHATFQSRGHVLTYFAHLFTLANPFVLTVDSLATPSPEYPTAETDVVNRYAAYRFTERTR
jgi:hypothetical protein